MQYTESEQITGIQRPRFVQVLRQQHGTKHRLASHCGGEGV